MAPYPAFLPRSLFRWRCLVALGLALATSGCRSDPGNAGTQPAKRSINLLNVSYDPTRELYAEFNKAFGDHWKQLHGQEVTIKQSHDGSGKQARSVIDGLEADVVTLALEHDITSISRKGLIAPEWKSRLPNDAAPYTSVIVLVVRRGNPKQIRDWDDLVRDGVQVITPNPKTGGGARLNYLAAWAFAMRKFADDEQRTRQFVQRVYKNAPVLDTGARGSAITFIERGIGDVLIAWENEALMAISSLGRDRFELIVPSLSILAEPSIAVVDAYANKHGTSEVAKAYLDYLYTARGQALIAKHHFRPRDPALLASLSSKFASLPLIRVSDLGGWDAVQKQHFIDGAVFDQLMAGAAK